MRKSVMMLALGALLLSGPAVAQTPCYPTWACETQGESVADILNRQQRDRTEQLNRERQQYEIQRLEDENRRLRALREQRRERRWMNQGIYVPHRSR